MKKRRTSYEHAIDFINNTTSFVNNRDFVLSLGARLYQPRKEILDGSWTFPNAEAVK